MSRPDEEELVDYDEAAEEILPPLPLPRLTATRRMVIRRVLMSVFTPPVSGGFRCFGFPEFWNVDASRRDFLLKPELLRAISDLGFEHPSEGKPCCQNIGNMC